MARERRLAGPSLSVYVQFPPVPIDTECLHVARQGRDRVGFQECAQEDGVWEDG